MRNGQKLQLVHVFVHELELSAVLGSEIVVWHNHLPHPQECLSPEGNTFLASILPLRG